MLIGIITAMDNELRPLLTEITIYKQMTICSAVFYIGKKYNHTIVLVCGGRGKVNTAIFTQQLITHFSPDLVINTGVSGGIEPNCQLQELYVGVRYCHHDVRKKQAQYTFPHQLYYFGDEQVIELIGNMDIPIRKGTFGTGEGFIEKEQQRKQLIEDFGINAVDMESAAAAQCCYLNDIRYVSVRGICDKADEKASATTEEFQEAISKKIAVLLSKLLMYIY